MMLKYALSICLVLILSACASQAPLPADHYYRLPELNSIAGDTVSKYEAISVIRFQADGLHKERALIYSEDGLELKQYHYHHWTSPPHQLLQQRLAEILRKRGISRLVLTTFEGNSELIIKGKVIAFERLVNESQDKVKVTLEFRVDANFEDLPLLYQSYTETVAVSEPSIISVVNSFDLAINTIFERFYTDFKTSSLSE